MKRILITGANSYIGTSFEKWMQQFDEDYQIDTIDMHGEAWKEKDFSAYDSIFHVAAIVHVKVKNEEIYYQVNRDLAVEVAKKAKKENVNQFIFFSTMSVFGKEIGIITNDTNPNPKNHYGQSKRQAEILLAEMQSDAFKIVIVRPPMIYGPHSVGNYQRLSKIAKMTRLFPLVNNERSMIYTENLFYFVKICLDNELQGVFHPQNSSYVNTSKLVRQIAIEHKKSIFFVKGCSALLNIISSKINIFKKVFGSLTYDYSLAGSPKTYFGNVYMDYASIDFESSIRFTENEDVNQ